MNPDHFEDPILDRRLAALREELETQQTPDIVEAQLRLAFSGRRKNSWLARVSQWFAPALGLAASVGMAAWISVAPLSNAGVAGPMTANDEGAPFLALQPLDRIAAEHQPRLIETEVPSVMLASLGVPINPEVAGQSLRAQMLVSAEGQPLAMRLTP